jgi:hypothetical protein
MINALSALMACVLAATALRLVVSRTGIASRFPRALGRALASPASLDEPP